NIEFAVADIGIWRRSDKDLVAGNPRRRGVCASKAGENSCRTREQLYSYLDSFASRLIWHDLEGVMGGTIYHGIDNCDFRIAVADRLVIGRMISVNRWVGTIENIKVIVRCSGASVVPEHRCLNSGVRMRGRIPIGQRHG